MAEIGGSGSIADATPEAEKHLAARTGEALTAPTLADALRVMEAAGRELADSHGQLPGFIHGKWMDANTRVLAHWGETPREGLLADADAMARPNPAPAARG